MKISHIKQQVKRHDRYSIYIDDVYSFSLSEYQLASSGLRVGKQLAQEELETLKGESSFGKAYERTLGYVTLRPRSEKELRDYLSRTFLYPKPKAYVDKSGQRHFKKVEVDKEAVNQLIDRVMERLLEKGYINDEAFASAWVRSRQMHKNYSTRKLRQELQQKGVHQDIIATVLQKEGVDERTNLQELITKKRRLTRYKDNDTLMLYLARQGFSYDDIKEALME